MSTPRVETADELELKSMIREIPDFPKPGILFYDITTLLKNPRGLRLVIDCLTENFRGQQIDAVLGIEARGFIFGPALAYHLGAMRQIAAGARGPREGTFASNPRS